MIFGDFGSRIGCQIVQVSVCCFLLLVSGLLDVGY